ncbi:pyridoxal phosphate-dependent aminotransferase [Desulfovermiculus halophilus]|jgi:aspartate/methionine/tyrosine aminotransferase|uniref:pyridoxal phosphate-dependent aminotransferase n=1 Tax=Desulfovermiculus halophilus TaxID=339722 RepID=UPI0004887F30|nr:pyridoxal phosphate-dependent aminotransferase [Desulfovermiculus halophilus]
MQPSSRTRDITPFLVMDVLEAAKKLEADGEHIVHLEIGEPDFDTPQCIKDAACRAIETGETHYTHSLGLLELREAICEETWQRTGRHVDPDQVIVTSGTSPAMLLCFATLLEHRESVIISDPGYACYANFISFAGGVPLPVPVYEHNGFQYTREDISKVLRPDTRGIMINSPANPTGTVLGTERLQDLAGMGPAIISDEIYQGLTYTGRSPSILEITDQAFVLNGFSKLYAMTGWRLGYLIAPRRFIREIQKLAQNLYICAGSIVQWAGLAALKEAAPDVEHMVGTYDQRRRFMIRRLREIGFGITTEPTGAFYILANARNFSSDSYRLAFDILQQAKVGVTPGVDFGANGEGYLRFSYANSLDNIAEGLDRIDRYLNG